MFLNKQQKNYSSLTKERKKVSEFDDKTHENQLLIDWKDTIGKTVDTFNFHFQQFLLSVPRKVR